MSVLLKLIIHVRIYVTHSSVVCLTLLGHMTYYACKIFKNVHICAYMYVCVITPE